MTELQTLVAELFTMLETQEESDSGRVFHPTTLTSCRSHHIKRLAEILPRMKEISDDHTNT
jgi:hypothetical protein